MTSAQQMAVPGTAPKPTTPAESPPPAQSQTALPNTPPVVPALEASEKRQESAAPDARPAGPPPPQPPVSSSEASAPNPPLPAQQAAALAPVRAPMLISARPHSASPKRIELPKPATTRVDVTAVIDGPSPAPSKPEEPRTQDSPKGQEAPKIQEPPKVQDASESAPKLAVLRTKFAVDVGTANSIAGLRALWRGLAKSNPELAALRPIIVVKENNTGLGMQLRLAAGPLTDAAAAAQICAKLYENERSCETTVFDGQRLAMKAEDAPSSAGSGPASPQMRANPKRAKKEEAPPSPPNTDPSTLTSLFGRKLP